MSRIMREDDILSVDINSGNSTTITNIQGKLIYAKFTKEVMKMMENRREECHCDKCGNEAEMTITCQMIDTDDRLGAKKKVQQETRTCTVCGGEMVTVMDE